MAGKRLITPLQKFGPYSIITRAFSLKFIVACSLLSYVIGQSFASDWYSWISSASLTLNNNLPGFKLSPVPCLFLPSNWNSISYRPLIARMLSELFSLLGELGSFHQSCVSSFWWVYSFLFCGFGASHPMGFRGILTAASLEFLSSVSNHPYSFLPFFRVSSVRGIP